MSRNDTTITKTTVFAFDQIRSKEYAPAPSNITQNKNTPNKTPFTNNVNYKPHLNYNNYKSNYTYNNNYNNNYNNSDNYNNLASNAHPTNSTCNNGSITMTIEIPRNYLSYGTCIDIPPCHKVTFTITSNTSFNDLISFIKENVIQLTYQGKAFADPKQFRISSKKCIFYAINKNAEKRESPLLKFHDWNKIPQYLSWDNGITSTPNSYKLTLKIKNNFKSNYYNLINDEIFKRILPKFNIHQSNKNDHEENKNNTRDHDTEDLKQFDEYKYELPQLFVSLCNNDKVYIKLWQKHQLYQKTDDQLYNELINMYRKYTQECKLYNNERAFKAQISQLKKEVDQKMYGAQHREMGYPLSPSQILSIILYCHKGMSKCLRQSQINWNKNQENLEKYIVFDFCLFWAITILHEFAFFDIKRKQKNDLHKVFLFSGASNILFKDQNLRSQKNAASRIEFVTHTSFSLNFNVACEYSKSFGGSNGSGQTILCLNESSFETIVCADVSWVSMFTSTEMEILVRRNCGTKYLKQVKTNGYNIVHLGEEAN